MLRAAVGDKYVSEKLVTEKLVLGGEPSGHIILHDIIPTADGILTALLLLETIQETDNWEMTTFEKYPQILINLPVTSQHDLQKTPLSDIINAAQEQLQSGRLIVRFSGTEPLLRIMIEAPCLDLAHHVGSLLKKQIIQFLQSI